MGNFAHNFAFQQKKIQKRVRVSSSLQASLVFPEGKVKEKVTNYNSNKVQLQKDSSVT